MLFGVELQLGENDSILRHKKGVAIATPFPL